jgi:hypothetical protein
MDSALPRGISLPHEIISPDAGTRGAGWWVGYSQQSLLFPKRKFSIWFDGRITRETITSIAGRRKIKCTSNEPDAEETHGAALISNMRIQKSHILEIKTVERLRCPNEGNAFNGRMSGIVQ